MTFKQGQIVKVALGDTFAFGRVSAVDQFGDGKASFKNGEYIISTAIVPEMVVDAFWQDGTGRYGV